MKVIGIIAEYNPFHNGHIYHIEKVKEMYPDSIIILVLNGYFLMRGEPSVLSKSSKTKIALENKIDLVVELPFFFGSNSADIFALSSIKILDELKCELLIFGSESNDIKKLEKIALKQLTTKFNDDVKNNLKSGINYPTALSRAINSDITTPNDLLGVSYIKSIKLLKSTIIPITIKRTNDYHDTLSNNEIISATNIRKKINNFEQINNYLPNSSLTSLNKINYELLFLLIKYQIITNTKLNTVLTVDEGIDNKLIEVINDVNNYEELVKRIKSKRYTYNRINRTLMHILVNLTKEDKLKHNFPEYIRVLGFNNNGQKYLNKIKKDNQILIGSKINDSLIKEYELKVASIYQMLTGEDVLSFERKNQPIKVDN